MRLSFTGTQHGMSPRQLGFITRFLKERRPFVAIHGGCTGADDEFDFMCAKHLIQRIVFPSNLPRKSIPLAILLARGKVKVFEAQPPLVRNRRLVDEGDYLIACPNQTEEILRSGTWATVRYARKINHSLEIVTP